MPIDRTWFNNLVDDDGSGNVGTIWNKATIKGLLDSIDGMFAPLTQWYPVDASGAGLSLGSPVGFYMKIDKVVFVMFAATWPSNSNGQQVTIGGLPFFVASVGNNLGAAIAYTTMPDVSIPFLANSK